MTAPVMSSKTLCVRNSLQGAAAMQEKFFGVSCLSGHLRFALSISTDDSAGRSASTVMRISRPWMARVQKGEISRKTRPL